MSIYLELFPPSSVTQKVSQYFVDLGTAGLWKYLTAQALLFYLLLFLTLYLFGSGEPSQMKYKSSAFKKVLQSNALFVFCFFLVILVSRLPSATAGQVNPDEANWIAISKTLLHDPRYWISADGGTGGPLVPMALFSLKIFGVSIDYGSIKIVAAMMMAVSIGFVYIGFTLIMGSAVARLGILPLVVAVSVMKQGDMIGYNSEHPVILLLSIGFFFLTRLYVAGAGKYFINIILLGFVLGMVPFAKLQGAPMGVVAGLIACFVVYKKLQLNRVPILILSALAPTIFTLIAVWSYGGLADFWQRFVNYNLTYTSQSAVSSFGDQMIAFAKVIYEPAELNYFLNYSFITILFSFLLVLSLLKVSKEGKLMLIFAVLFLCSSIYSINASGRFFPHYLLLFLFPLTILLGVLLSLVAQGAGTYLQENGWPVPMAILKIPVATVLLFVSSFYYFQANFSYSPAFVEKAKSYVSGYSSYGEIIAVLNRYYTPGAKMAIWGWANELWAGSDFLMGTRDGGSMGTKDGEDYYTKCYLTDLQRNEPLIFLEAVAPNFFAYNDRSAHGFEVNSAVKKYIDDNYFFEAEINGARIYIRKNALSPKKQWVSRGLPKRPDKTEGYSGDFAITKMGTVVQFRGWMLFNVQEDSLRGQNVRCALYNQTDTLLIQSYKKIDWVVVAYFNNRNFTWSGFEGYFDCKEIPKGEYNVGLYVENGGLSLLADMKRTVTLSETCDTFK